MFWLICPGFHGGGVAIPCSWLSPFFTSVVFPLPLFPMRATFSPPLISKFVGFQRILFPMIPLKSIARITVLPLKESSSGRLILIGGNSLIFCIPSSFSRRVSIDDADFRSFFWILAKCVFAPFSLLSEGLTLFGILIACWAFCSFSTSAFCNCLFFFSCCS